MSFAIVAGLFLHYAAAMALFGTAIFRLIMADDAMAAAIDRSLRPILLAAAAVALFSGAVLLLLEAGAMGGAWSFAIDSETVGAVLTDTAFGRVWQWHLALAAVAVVACAVAAPGRPWIAAVATLLLASLALVGHAAMVDGVAGALRRLNQAVHLLAAGGWLGGLIPLAMILRATRNHPGAAIGALRRFSTYGTIAVALILATGAVNAASLVDGMGGLFGSPYGWTLLVKLALVVAMISCAYSNRFRLVPRLTQDPERAAAQLRRSIGLEIVLGVLVVVVASLLGTLMPPGA